MYFSSTEEPGHHDQRKDEPLTSERDSDVRLVHRVKQELQVPRSE